MRVACLYDPDRVRLADAQRITDPDAAPGEDGAQRVPTHVRAWDMVALQGAGV